MFKKKIKVEGETKPQKGKVSAIMQLLAEKLEYYPDINRKNVVVDLMLEVEKRKI